MFSTQSSFLQNVSSNSTKNPQDQLSGKIIRITFHNSENFFTVAKIEAKGQKGEIAVVGTMPFVQEGLSVKLQGSWTVDPRHGKQFAVEKYTYELPQDPEGLEQFLSSGILPGVGKKTASKLVDHFGSNILHILESQQDKLYELSSLGEKKIQSIIAAWNEHSQFQELSYILLSWGITHKQAVKIVKKWGHESVSIIKKNPYTLAKEIRGIGFQLADAIAMSIGFDKTSKERLHAAVEFFLWEKANEGHTAPLLEDFISYSAEQLNVTTENIQDTVKDAVAQGALSLFVHPEKATTQVQIKHLHFIEQSIAKEAARLFHATPSLRSIDIVKALSWAESKSSLTLHEAQRNACKMVIENQFSIITGGPGTGKSTILRVILAIFEKLTSKIILAAPTGKAAKRMQEITGKPSKTIHRLLHFDPIKNSFEYNNKNPLIADLIVIDESSMLDSQLTYFLLRAIPTGAKVVIVGDVNQLPSIGAGAVLSDLISSQKIATTHLTEVFRQAKQSCIIQSAHRILHGELPYLKNTQGSDFLFVTANEPKEAQETILDLVVNKIPNTFGFNPKNDIQVLAPMKKGEIGCDMLNSILQAHFANRKDTSANKRTFVVGDKVMQIKNNYKKDVYNGDVGWVERLDQEAGTMQVTFDDQTHTYDALELEELVLAWAVSVHKYQGSEIPCVIIPVHTQHFRMLTRNLLYTAVTRGKKLVVLVGTVKAIAIAVKQKESMSRWTCLPQRLSEAFAIS